MTKPDTVELPFTIGLPRQSCYGVRVLTFKNGGCRPANEQECLLYDRLQAAEEAIERVRRICEYDQHYSGMARKVLQALTPPNEEKVDGQET